MIGKLHSDCASKAHSSQINLTRKNKIDLNMNYDWALEPTYLHHPCFCLYVTLNMNFD